MMKNRVLLSGFMFSCLCCLTLNTAHTATEAMQTVSAAALQTECKSAYCMDADSGTEVYAANEKERLPIASMCKIMTLILSFDAVESGKMTYDTLIPVSEHAMSMGGSQVYLEAGGEYSAEQLIEGIVVCSANDACVAMAEYVAGSDDAFVEKMNERAKELGCENTLFANCTGLPEEPQYSCAYDVAKMLNELITHEKYFSFSKIWTDDFKHPEGRTTLITNTNKLIRRYTGCDGGKTGFTNQAGFCLAATATRGDMRIISVCIGAPSSEKRFEAVSGMFDYAFANYTQREILPAGQPITQKLTVKNAKKKSVEVMPEKAVRYFSKRGEDEGEITYTVKFSAVKAPFEKGARVGELTVFRNGKQYEKVPLLSCEKVEKATFGDYFRRVADGWVA